MAETTITSDADKLFPSDAAKFNARFVPDRY